MTPIVPIVLFGYLPVTLLAFALLRPRTALILCLLVGWLFLPLSGFRLPGLPDYTKYSAISVSCLLAVALFDHRRLFQFRPHWVDLPMLVWCLTPIASSLTNDLGIYDGLSEMLVTLMQWGVPYFLGRLYLSDPEGLRALGVGIVAISLLYLVLCLWEVRFSPQLHRMVYGFHPSEFRQQMRGGGFRPMVFIGHGLSISKWYTIALLWALWLWRSRSVKHYLGVPIGVATALMVLGLLVSRSVTGLALTSVGGAALFWVYLRRSTWPVLLLCLLPLGYVLGRSADMVPTEPLVRAAALISEERAQSLEFRLTNEHLLLEKAMDKPLFGWGGWGRSRVYDEWGNDVSITDGLWIIALGQNGMVGMLALMLLFLLPAWLLVYRLPGSSWSHPLHGAAATAAVILLLMAINALPNAPYDPVTAAMAGGASGLAVRLPSSRRSKTNRAALPGV